VTHGSRLAYLFRLAVDKQYRGKGVGSKLLQHAEELLRKKGFLEVAFFVNDQKEELKEYYKKRNYRTSGKKYITMWKPL
jgi:ribosomal protein S18 acetylase RimI-like enzyme